MWIFNLLEMRKTLTFFLAILFYLNSNFGCCQSGFYIALADSALTLVGQKVVYDPSYFSIDYPNGYIPSDKGVCIDIMIKVY